MLSAVDNFATSIDLFFVDRTQHSRGNKLREVQNCVERRAEFVRHTGKELRLDAIGLFGFLACLMRLSKKLGIAYRDGNLLGERGQHFDVLVAELVDLRRL